MKTKPVSGFNFLSRLYGGKPKEMAVVATECFLSRLYGGKLPFSRPRYSRPFLSRLYGGKLDALRRALSLFFSKPPVRR